MTQRVDPFGDPAATAGRGIPMRSASAVPATTRTAPALPFDPTPDSTVPTDSFAAEPRRLREDPFGPPRPVIATAEGVVRAPAPTAETRSTEPARSSGLDRAFVTDPLAVAALVVGLIPAIGIPVALWLVNGPGTSLLLVLSAAALVALAAIVLAIRSWRRPGPMLPRRRRLISLVGGVLGAAGLLGTGVTGVVSWLSMDDQKAQNAVWANACTAGSDLSACDQLLNAALTTADQRDTAQTCGERAGSSRPAQGCGSMVVSSTGHLVPADGDEEAWTYGDAEELDTLWDVCGEGDGPSCDQLVADAPVGSEYEDYGSTCGLRVEAPATTCVDEIGALTEPEPVEAPVDPDAVDPDAPAAEAEDPAA